MKLITTLTRMWLTRTLKPFKFTNEYDNNLSFDQCENLGIYVHIPFCVKLCAFCPYCKEIYSEDKANKYIDYLIKEIHMVGSQIDEKKKVTSLYFGGGTPALVTSRLEEIISAIEEHFIISEGIGLELHPENVNEATLLSLKRAGVTKISIGIQSFQEKFLSILGRNKLELTKMSKSLKKVPFETVSMDFIFALPNQKIEDLKSDIDMAFSNGANHIAIYPFIDFTFTKHSIKAMGKWEKRKLLDEITLYCQAKGYDRDSIWTFSNNPKAKYSSMTRNNFLGFGCSATTLLRDQFKVNTFSVEAYEARIVEQELPTSLTIKFTKRQRMIYFLFWTAYSTKVKAEDFKRFFDVSLKASYGFEFWIAKKLGFITEDKGVFQMTLKGAFYYHYYESYYTLSYIDKMWGIMKGEAFPKMIKF